MQAKGFRIEDDTVWLSDGVTEYPLKLSKINRNLTERRSNRGFDRTLIRIL